MSDGAGSDGNDDSSAPVDGGTVPSDGGGADQPGSGGSDQAGAPDQPGSGGSDQAGAPDQPQPLSANSDQSGGDDSSATTVPVGRGSGDGTGTNAVATPITVAMKVRCGHTSLGIREVDGNPVMARLQIVPTTGQTTISDSFSCLGGRLKIGISKVFGGTDTVESTLFLSGGTDESGGSGAADPQIAITQNNPPADSDWQSVLTRTTSIPSPDTNSNWTPDAQPTLWQVLGRGHSDDIPVRVQVEAYPSLNVSGSISGDFFKVVAQDINDQMRQLLVLMNQLPVQVVPQIQLPAGTLSVSWGWQENSDWTACHGLTINAQINPLVGVGVQFKVNALALAAMVADVPPSISKYLGAVILGFGISGQINVNGAVIFKGPNVSGSLGPSGQIDFTVEGEAKAGDPDVIGTGVKLSSTAGIKWTGTLDPPSSGGLVLHQTLTFTGLVGSVSVTLKAFGIEDTGNQQITIWPAGSPATLQDWHLIDP